MRDEPYWHEQAILGVGAETAPEPEWDGNSVPHCTEDACPDYDGKRCRLMGQRPHGLCYPVVEAMAVMLNKHR